MLVGLVIVIANNSFEIFHELVETPPQPYTHYVFYKISRTLKIMCLIMFENLTSESWKSFKESMLAAKFRNCTILSEEHPDKKTYHIFISKSLGGDDRHQQVVND